MATMEILNPASGESIGDVPNMSADEVDAAVEPVVSVIAGATKPEQVRANAAAGEWEPTAVELREVLNT